MNSVIALFCFLNFYLPLSAEAWPEVRSAMVVAGGLFLITGPVLLLRVRLIWHTVRILCYVNALVLVLYFISLIGKGYLLTLPVYTLLFLVFGFYFIGIRGYLNAPDVRAEYGISVLN